MDREPVQGLEMQGDVVSFLRFDFLLFTIDANIMNYNNHNELKIK